MVPSQGQCLQGKRPVEWYYPDTVKQLTRKKCAQMRQNWKNRIWNRIDSTNSKTTRVATVIARFTLLEAQGLFDTYHNYLNPSSFSTARQARPVNGFASHPGGCRTLELKKARTTFTKHSVRNAATPNRIIWGNKEIATIVKKAKFSDQHSCVQGCIRADQAFLGSGKIWIN